MKKMMIVTSLVLGLISGVAQASTLTCAQETKGSTHDYGAGLGSSTVMNCGDSDDNSYRVSIAGFGPSIRFSGVSGLLISCTAKNPVGTYYGVQGELGAFFGVALGVTASGRGVCTFGKGAIFCAGAECSIAQLTIEFK